MALRTCRVCGHQALTEADLKKFQVAPDCRYGRANLCHACKATQYTREEHNAYLRQWRLENPQKVIDAHKRFRDKKRLEKLSAR